MGRLSPRARAREAKAVPKVVQPRSGFAVPAPELGSARQLISSVTR